MWFLLCEYFTVSPSCPPRPKAVRALPLLGDVLWSQNYGSPVIGVYLYSGDSLRHAPHLSLAMETLQFLTFSSASEHADAHSTLKWSYQFVKEQASAQTQLV